MSYIFNITMYRKLIQQGKGAFTITLPRSWISTHNLTKEDVVELEEVESALVIEPIKKQSKKKSLRITLDEDSVEGYRNIIGSLYRQGFDEIIVTTKKEQFMKIEQAINSIFGLELFLLNNSTVQINTIYANEDTDVKKHVQRTIYSIKAMQEIIFNDISYEKYNNFSELTSIRGNILKQRDLISRIIKKEKLFSDEIFPYYTINQSLWSITRNYYHMYNELRGNEDLEIFEKVMLYSKEVFDKFEKKSSVEGKRHEKYLEVLNYLKEKIRKGSVIGAFSLSIVQELQLIESNLSLKVYCVQE